ncbi:hypothetical protein Btru_037389 [Bulinus truncatus]|nr:hypothetical protein Btru_037389 [Bulinus truncatus]
MEHDDCENHPLDKNRPSPDSKPDIRLHRKEDAAQRTFLDSSACVAVKPYLHQNTLDIVDGIRLPSVRARSVSFLPAIEESQFEDKEDQGPSESRSASYIPPSRFYLSGRVSSKPALTSISEERLSRGVENTSYVPQNEADGECSGPRKRRRTPGDDSKKCFSHGYGDVAADVRERCEERMDLLASDKLLEITPQSDVALGKSPMSAPAGGEGLVPYDERVCGAAVDGEDRIGHRLYEFEAQPRRVQGDDREEMDYSNNADGPDPVDGPGGSSSDQPPAGSAGSIRSNTSPEPEDSSRPGEDACSEAEGLTVSDTRQHRQHGSTTLTTSSDRQREIHALLDQREHEVISEESFPLEDDSRPSGTRLTEGVGMSYAHPMGDTCVLRERNSCSPSECYLGLDQYIQHIITSSACDVIARLTIEDSQVKLQKSEDNSCHSGEQMNHAAAHNVNRSKGSGSDSRLADVTAGSGDVSAPRESHSEHTSMGVSASGEKQDKEFKDKEPKKQRDKDQGCKQRGRERERNKRKKERDDMAGGSGGKRKWIRNALGDVKRAKNKSLEGEKSRPLKEIGASETASDKRKIPVQGKDDSGLALSSDDIIGRILELKKTAETLERGSRNEDMGDVKERNVKSTCGLEHQTVTANSESPLLEDGADPLDNPIDLICMETEFWDEGERSDEDNPFNVESSKTSTGRLGKRAGLHRQRQSTSDLSISLDMERATLTLAAGPRADPMGLSEIIELNGEIFSENSCPNEYNLDNSESSASFGQGAGEALIDDCAVEVNKGKPFFAAAPRALMPVEVVYDESFNHPPKYVESNPSDLDYAHDTSDQGHTDRSVDEDNAVLSSKDLERSDQDLGDDDSHHKCVEDHWDEGAFLEETLKAHRSLHADRLMGGKDESLDGSEYITANNFEGTGYDAADVVGSQNYANDLSEHGLANLTCEDDSFYDFHCQKEDMIEEEAAEDFVWSDAGRGGGQSIDVDFIPEGMTYASTWQDDEVRSRPGVDDIYGVGGDRTDDHIGREDDYVVSTRGGYDVSADVGNMESDDVNIIIIRAAVNSTVDSDVNSAVNADAYSAESSGANANEDKPGTYDMVVSGNDKPESPDTVVGAIIDAGATIVAANDDSLDARATIVAAKDDTLDARATIVAANDDTFQSRATILAANDDTLDARATIVAANDDTLDTSEFSKDITVHPTLSPPAEGNVQITNPPPDDEQQALNSMVGDRDVGQDTYQCEDALSPGDTDRPPQCPEGDAGDSSVTVTDGLVHSETTQVDQSEQAAVIKDELEVSSDGMQNVNIEVKVESSPETVVNTNDEELFINHEDVGSGETTSSEGKENILHATYEKDLITFDDDETNTVKPEHHSMADDTKHSELTKYVDDVDFGYYETRKTNHRESIEKRETNYRESTETREMKYRESSVDVVVDSEYLYQGDVMHVADVLYEADVDNIESYRHVGGPSSLDMGDVDALVPYRHGKNDQEIERIRDSSIDDATTQNYTLLASNGNSDLKKTTDKEDNSLVEFDREQELLPGCQTEITSELNEYYNSRELKALLEIGLTLKSDDIAGTTSEKMIKVEMSDVGHNMVHPNPNISEGDKDLTKTEHGDNQDGVSCQVKSSDFAKEMTGADFEVSVEKECDEVGDLSRDGNITIENRAICSDDGLPVVVGSCVDVAGVENVTRGTSAAGVVDVDMRDISASDIDGKEVDSSIIYLDGDAGHGVCIEMNTIANSVDLEGSNVDKCNAITPGGAWMDVGSGFIKNLELHFNVDDTGLPTVTEHVTATAAVEEDAEDMVGEGGGAFSKAGQACADVDMGERIVDDQHYGTSSRVCNISPQWTSASQDVHNKHFVEIVGSNVDNESATDVDELNMAENQVMLEKQIELYNDQSDTLISEEMHVSQEIYYTENAVKMLGGVVESVDVIEVGAGGGAGTPAGVEQEGGDGEGLTAGNDAAAVVASDVQRVYSGEGVAVEILKNADPEVSGVGGEGNDDHVSVVAGIDLADAVHAEKSEQLKDDDHVSIEAGIDLADAAHAEKSEQLKDDDHVSIVAGIDLADALHAEKSEQLKKDGLNEGVVHDSSPYPAREDTRSDVHEAILFDDQSVDVANVSQFEIRKYSSDSPTLFGPYPDDVVFDSPTDESNIRTVKEMALGSSNVDRSPVIVVDTSLAHVTYTAPAYVAETSGTLDTLLPDARESEVDTGACGEEMNAFCSKGKLSSIGVDGITPGVDTAVDEVEVTRVANRTTVCEAADGSVEMIDDGLGVNDVDIAAGSSDVTIIHATYVEREHSVINTEKAADNKEQDSMDTSGSTFKDKKVIPRVNSEVGDSDDVNEKSGLTEERRTSLDVELPTFTPLSETGVVIAGSGEDLEAQSREITNLNQPSENGVVLEASQRNPGFQPSHRSSETRVSALATRNEEQETMSGVSQALDLKPGGPPELNARSTAGAPGEVSDAETTEGRASQSDVVGDNKNLTGEKSVDVSVYTVLSSGESFRAAQFEDKTGLNGIGSVLAHDEIMGEGFQKAVETQGKCFTRYEKNIEELVKNGTLLNDVEILNEIKTEVVMVPGDYARIEKTDFENNAPLEEMDKGGGVSVEENVGSEETQEGVVLSEDEDVQKGEGSVLPESIHRHTYCTVDKYATVGRAECESVVTESDEGLVQIDTDLTQAESIETPVQRKVTEDESEAYDNLNEENIRRGKMLRHIVAPKDDIFEEISIILGEVITDIVTMKCDGKMENEKFTDIENVQEGIVRWTSVTDTVTEITLAGRNADGSIVTGDADVCHELRQVAADTVHQESLSLEQTVALQENTVGHNVRGGIRVCGEINTHNDNDVDTAIAFENSKCLPLDETVHIVIKSEDSPPVAVQSCSSIPSEVKETQGLVDTREVTPIVTETKLDFEITALRLTCPAEIKISEKPLKTDEKHEDKLYFKEYEADEKILCREEYSEHSINNEKEIKEELPLEGGPVQSDVAEGGVTEGDINQYSAIAALNKGATIDEIVKEDGDEFLEEDLVQRDSKYTEVCSEENVKKEEISDIRHEDNATTRGVVNEDNATSGGVVNEEDAIIVDVVNEENANIGDMANEDNATSGDVVNEENATIGDMANEENATIGDMANEVNANIGDMANEENANIGDMANEENTTIGDVVNEENATIGDVVNEENATIGDVVNEVRASTREMVNEERSISSKDNIPRLIITSELYLTEEKTTLKTEVLIDTTEINEVCAEMIPVELNHQTEAAPVGQGLRRNDVGIAEEMEDIAQLGECVAPDIAQLDECVAPDIAQLGECVAPDIAQLGECVAPDIAQLGECVAPDNAQLGECVAPDIVTVQRDTCRVKEMLEEGVALEEIIASDGITNDISPNDISPSDIPPNDIPPNDSDKDDPAPDVITFTKEIHQERDIIRCVLGDEGVDSAVKPGVQLDMVCKQEMTTAAVAPEKVAALPELVPTGEHTHVESMDEHMPIPDIAVSGDVGRAHQENVEDVQNDMCYSGENFCVDFYTGVLNTRGDTSILGTDESGRPVFQEGDVPSDTALRDGDERGDVVVMETVSHGGNTFEDAVDYEGNKECDHVITGNYEAGGEKVIGDTLSRGDVHGDGDIRGEEFHEEVDIQGEELREEVDIQGEELREEVDIPGECLLEDDTITEDDDEEEDALVNQEEDGGAKVAEGEDVLGAMLSQVRDALEDLLTRGEVILGNLMTREDDTYVDSVIYDKIIEDAVTQKEEPNVVSHDEDICGHVVTCTQVHKDVVADNKDGRDKILRNEDDDRDETAVCDKVRIDFVTNDNEAREETGIQSKDAHREMVSKENMSDCKVSLEHNVNGPMVTFEEDPRADIATSQTDATADMCHFEECLLSDIMTRKEKSGRGVRTYAEVESSDVIPCQEFESVNNVLCENDILVEVIACTNDVHIDMTNPCQEDVHIDITTCQEDVHIDMATCQGDIHIDMATCQGDIHIDMATCQEDVQIDMATCQEDVQIDMATCQEDVQIDMATCQEGVHIDMAACQEDVQIDMATCQEDVHIDMATWQEDVHIDMATCQEDVHIDMATCQEDVHIDMATCQEDVHIDMATCQEDVHIDMATCQEDVHVDMATCQEDVHIDMSTCQEDVHIDMATCQEDVHIDMTTCQEDVHIDMATCQEDVDIDMATCQEDVHIDMATWQDDISIHTVTRQEDIRIDMVCGQDNVQTDMISCQDAIRIDMVTCQDDAYGELTTSPGEVRIHMVTCHDELRKDTFTFHKDLLAEIVTCQNNVRFDMTACQDNVRIDMCSTIVAPNDELPNDLMKDASINKICDEVDIHGESDMLMKPMTSENSSDKFEVTHGDTGGMENDKTEFTTEREVMDVTSEDVDENRVCGLVIPKVIVTNIESVQEELLKQGEITTDELTECRVNCAEERVTGDLEMTRDVVTTEQMMSRTGDTIGHAIHTLGRGHFQDKHFDQDLTSERNYNDVNWAMETDMMDLTRRKMALNHMNGGEDKFSTLGESRSNELKHLDNGQLYKEDSLTGCEHKNNGQIYNEDISTEKKHEGNSQSYNETSSTERKQDDNSQPYDEASSSESSQKYIVQAYNEKCPRETNPGDVGHFTDVFYCNEPSEDDVSQQFTDCGSTEHIQDDVQAITAEPSQDNIYRQPYSEVNNSDVDYLYSELDAIGRMSDLLGAYGKVNTSPHTHYTLELAVNNSHLQAHVAEAVNNDSSLAGANSVTEHEEVRAKQSVGVVGDTVDVSEGGANVMKEVNAVEPKRSAGASGMREDGRRYDLETGIEVTEQCVKLTEAVNLSDKRVELTEVIEISEQSVNVKEFITISDKISNGEEDKGNANSPPQSVMERKANFNQVIHNRVISTPTRNINICESIKLQDNGIEINEKVEIQSVQMTPACYVSSDTSGTEFDHGYSPDQLVDNPAAQEPDAVSNANQEVGDMAVQEQEAVYNTDQLADNTTVQEQEAVFYTDQLTDNTAVQEQEAVYNTDQLADNTAVQEQEAVYNTDQLVDNTAVQEHDAVYISDQLADNTVVQEQEAVYNTDQLVDNTAVQEHDAVYNSDQLADNTVVQEQEAVYNTDQLTDNTAVQEQEAVFYTDQLTDNTAVQEQEAVYNTDQLVDNTAVQEQEAVYNTDQLADNTAVQEQEAVYNTDQLVDNTAVQEHDAVYNSDQLADNTVVQEQEAVYNTDQLADNTAVQEQEAVYNTDQLVDNTAVQEHDAVYISDQLADNTVVQEQEAVYNTDQLVDNTAVQEHDAVYNSDQLADNTVVQEQEAVYNTDQLTDNTAVQEQETVFYTDQLTDNTAVQEQEAVYNTDQLVDNTAVQEQEAVYNTDQLADNTAVQEQEAVYNTDQLVDNTAVQEHDAVYNSDQLADNTVVQEQEAVYNTDQLTDNTAVQEQEAVFYTDQLTDNTAVQEQKAVYNTDQLADNTAVQEQEAVYNTDQLVDNTAVQEQEAVYNTDQLADNTAVQEQEAVYNTDQLVDNTAVQELTDNTAVQEQEAVYNTDQLSDNTAVQEQEAVYNTDQLADNTAVQEQEAVYNTDQLVDNTAVQEHDAVYNSDQLADNTVVQEQEAVYNTDQLADNTAVQEQEAVFYTDQLTDNTAVQEQKAVYNTDQLADNTAVQEQEAVYNTDQLVDNTAVQEHDAVYNSDQLADNTVVQEQEAVYNTDQLTDNTAVQEQEAVFYTDQLTDNTAVQEQEAVYNTDQLVDNTAVQEQEAVYNTDQLVDNTAVQEQEAVYNTDQLADNTAVQEQEAVYNTDQLVDNTAVQEHDAVYNSDQLADNTVVQEQEAVYNTDQLADNTAVQVQEAVYNTDHLVDNSPLTPCFDKQRVCHEVEGNIQDSFKATKESVSFPHHLFHSEPLTQLSHFDQQYHDGGTSRQHDEPLYLPEILREARALAEQYRPTVCAAQHSTDSALHSTDSALHSTVSALHSTDSALHLEGNIDQHSADGMMLATAERGDHLDGQIMIVETPREVKPHRSEEETSLCSSGASSVDNAREDEEECGSSSSDMEHQHLLNNFDSDQEELVADMTGVLYIAARAHDTDSGCVQARMNFPEIKSFEPINNAIRPQDKINSVVQIDDEIQSQDEIRSIGQVFDETELRERLPLRDHVNNEIKSEFNDESKPYVQSYDKTKPRDARDDEMNPFEQYYDEIKPQLYVKDEANPSVLNYSTISLNDGRNPFRQSFDEISPQCKDKDGLIPHGYSSYEIKPQGNEFNEMNPYEHRFDDITIHDNEMDEMNPFEQSYDEIKLLDQVYDKIKPLNQECKEMLILHQMKEETISPDRELDENNRLDEVYDELKPLDEMKPLDEVYEEMKPLDEVYDEMKPIDEMKPLDEVYEEIKPLDEVYDEMKPIDEVYEEIKPLDEVYDEMKPIDEMKPLDEVYDEMKPIDEMKPLDEVYDEMKPLNEVYDEMKPLDEVYDEMKPLDEIKRLDEMKPLDEVIDEMKPLDEVYDEIKPLDELCDEMKALDEMKSLDEIILLDEVYDERKPSDEVYDEMKPFVVYGEIETYGNDYSEARAPDEVCHEVKSFDDVYNEIRQLHEMCNEVLPDGYSQPLDITCDQINEHGDVHVETSPPCDEIKPADISTHEIHAPDLPCDGNQPSGEWRLEMGSSNDEMKPLKVVYDVQDSAAPSNEEFGEIKPMVVSCNETNHPEVKQGLWRSLDGAFDRIKPADHSHNETQPMDAKHDQTENVDVADDVTQRNLLNFDLKLVEDDARELISSDSIPLESVDKIFTEMEASRSNERTHETCELEANPMDQPLNTMVGSSEFGDMLDQLGADKQRSCGDDGELMTEFRLKFGGGTTSAEVADPEDATPMDREYHSAPNRALQIDAPVRDAESDRGRVEEGVGRWHLQDKPVVHDRHPEQESKDETSHLIVDLVNTDDNLDSLDQWSSHEALAKESGLDVGVNQPAEQHDVESMNRSQLELMNDTKDVPVDKRDRQVEVISDEDQVTRCGEQILSSLYRSLSEDEKEDDFRLASIVSSQEEIYIPKVTVQIDADVEKEKASTEALQGEGLQTWPMLENNFESAFGVSLSPVVKLKSSDIGDGKIAEKCNEESVLLDKSEEPERLLVVAADNEKDATFESSPLKLCAERDEKSLPLVKETKDGRRRVKKSKQQALSLMDFCSDSTVAVRTNRTIPQKTKSTDECALLNALGDEADNSEESPSNSLKATRSSPAPGMAVKRIQIVGVEDFPKDVPCVYYPDDVSSTKPTKEKTPAAPKLSNIRAPTKHPATRPHKKTSLWKRLKSILKAPRLTRRDGKFRFVKKYKKDANLGQAEPPPFTRTSVSECDMERCEGASSQHTAKLGQHETRDQDSWNTWHSSPVKPGALKNKAKSRRNEWRQFRRLRLLRHSAEMMGPTLPPIRVQTVSSRNYVRMYSEDYQRSQDSKFVSSGADDRPRRRRRKKRRSKSRSSKQAQSPLLEHPKENLATKRCELANSAAPEVFEIFCDDDEESKEIKEEPTVRMLMKPLEVQPRSGDYVVWSCDLAATIGCTSFTRDRRSQCTTAEI